ncbi:hypothetical protein B5P45_04030 [Phyllobacterium zundukense]|uniref:Uncharacterized protein n=1 Tax=Phyllobacterium zundukense TaxID=1867719 RepID=A0A2N9W305_9HYPH|nr:hypothetical protein BLM14_20220 [Phyllobacterium zundukense]PIO46123.1 hypothetical protein B5P45_04030 [Phyllobacterium zundukense]
MSDLFPTIRADRGFSLDFSFLFVEWVGKPLWMWASFLALVIAILSFDLGILHKQNVQEIQCKRCAARTLSVNLRYDGEVAQP